MYRTEGYKSLIVWQKSYKFSLEIYRVTKSFPKEELYGLISQLRRAATSIPLNVAEGYSRASKKEFLQFLIIGKGSCAEIETLLLFSKDLGYINEATYRELDARRVEIAKVLQGLIRSIRGS